MNMQIVLLVTVSRHAIHHNNISNNAGWPVTVLNRCIWTFPSTLFRQRYIWKMAKKEVANVSRFYLSNLRRFWIVKLPFMTLWVFMTRHKSHVVFSRRFLQDFAICSRGHWLGMIWIVAYMCDARCQRMICVVRHVELCSWGWLRGRGSCSPVREWRNWSGCPL